MTKSTVIVLVADHDDPKHGEITVLEDQAEAEQMIESLLEAGFEQDRIRVFAGVENAMKISYRPVVTLEVGATDEPAPPDRESAAAEPTPEDDSSEPREQAEVSSDTSW